MLSQMNMFKRKGPTPDEIIRETNLKRNISKEFSRILKVLQQRHMNAEDPIYSDDEANSLCNILEAVFLHGLKDSIATKLVSYVNFASQVPDTRITVNFWNFVVKFTHKDVISQLKQLPQITSDTGLCRAWVRLALNDGLMESYLHSVIGDAKTLQYYYNQTAYLRDHEQPGILKSYLSGLMTLTFQLSYNSSVLNDWTSTPLVLAGLVDSQTPGPIFQVRAATDKKTSSENKSSLHPPRINRNRSQEQRDDNDIANSQVDNQPSLYNTQGFTRAEMEAIKNLNMASSPYTASECSSSSHISCPDPSNGTAPSLDPSLIENQILQEIMAQNAADLRKARDGQQLSIRRSKEDKKRKSAEVSPSLPKKHEENVKIEVSNENDKIVRDSEMQDQSSALLASVADNTLEVTDTDINTQSCDTLLGETLESSTITIPDEQNIDKTLDLTAEPSDSTNSKPELPLLDEAESSPFDQFPNKRQKSESEMCPAIDGNIKTEQISERPPNSVDNELASNTENQIIPNSEAVAEYFEETGSPRSMGNKLGAMTGWSSEFEHSGEYLSKRNLAIFDSSTEENLPGRVSARAESFRTLLKNYEPPSAGSPGASLEQVINTLPESVSVSDKDTTDSANSPGRLMKTQWSEEQLDDDFELVESVPQIANFDSSANPNSRLAHFKEIAVEKGLDSQNYQCKGCTRPVGLIYGNPRVCSFDGGYYCFECHENDEYCIPAHVVFNWDFRKQKVARINSEYLQQMEEQPVLDLEELNPRIYEYIPEIEEVRSIRQQLCSLKTYLFSCHQNVAVELRKKVWPREHMYDSRHLYSLADLQQIPSGQLARFLKEVVKFASKHVYDCSLCCQKGFICEVCNNSKVIYPFEVETTYRCTTCKAVYHKTCMTENLPCPKCVRWRLRKSSFHESPADSMDYAITPP